MERLLLLYCLLKETSKQNEDSIREPVTLVDFDDVSSYYICGLNIGAYDMTYLGVHLGLLSRYEDNLYYVDFEQWHFYNNRMNISMCNFNWLQ
jgi:hypothetical protein